MKIFKSLAIALVATFALTSCNNPEKVLPKGEGMWDASSTAMVSTTMNGTTSDTTIMTTSTMEFMDDGSGVMMDDTNHTDFMWAYSKENDQISITVDDTMTVTYDIIESSGKAQTWHAMWTESMTIFGMEITMDYDVTSDLTKK